MAPARLVTNIPGALRELGYIFQERAAEPEVIYRILDTQMMRRHFGMRAADIMSKYRLRLPDAIQAKREKNARRQRPASSFLQPSTHPTVHPASPDRRAHGAANQPARPRNRREEVNPCPPPIHICPGSRPK